MNIKIQTIYTVYIRSYRNQQKRVIMKNIRMIVIKKKEKKEKEF